MEESIRLKLLEELRGLPQNITPPFLPKKIGDVLPSIFEEFGLQNRASEEQMRQEWREIVGEFLARHSFPESLQGGCLVVRVLQPSIRYELEVNMKKQILAKLQGMCGYKKISDLKFLPG
ncbi:MAG: DUF721 domain-containing protein [Chthoniobacterales bacterium]|nr:DUF721 domain-containing protein [Chthoniobacterales bacterium]